MFRDWWSLFSSLPSFSLWVFGNRLFVRFNLKLRIDIFRCSQRYYQCWSSLLNASFTLWRKNNSRCKKHEDEERRRRRSYSNIAWVCPKSVVINCFFFSCGDEPQSFWSNRISFKCIFDACIGFISLVVLSFNIDLRRLRSNRLWSKKKEIISLKMAEKCTFDFTSIGQRRKIQTRKRREQNKYYSRKK